MVLASPVIYGLNVHNKKYVCNSFGLRFHNFFKILDKKQK